MAQASVENRSGARGGVAERYVVVSADGHVGPSVRGQLREFCPSQYLADFDAYAEVQAGHGSMLPLLMSERYTKIRAPYTVVAGLQDPHARLRDMDAEGIAAEVIYHGGSNGESIPFSTTSLLSWSDPAFNHLETVGVRIYNRWLADFVSHSPERHAGIAHIPISDPEACVREVEWAAEAGLNGINLPAPRRDFSPYNDPVWEALWAACEATGMSLNTHSGGGDVYPYQGVESGALFLMEAYFVSRRATWALIFSGVFERHPGLKFVVAEQGADWVPQLLRNMDSCYFAETSDLIRDVLPKPPSEYWMANCWVGSSFMAKREAELGLENGVGGKLLWGADYPHAEGTWPRTLNSLRKTYSALAPADVARYVGGNAIDVYGFDRDHLEAIAARIGPTVEAVAEPYELPEGEFPGYAFRDLGDWS